MCVARAPSSTQHAGAKTHIVIVMDSFALAFALSVWNLIASVYLPTIVYLEVIDTVVLRTVTLIKGPL